VRVLFMLPESSSLGGAVEGGRSVSTSSSSSSRLGRVGFICAAHDTAFPDFSFAHLKAAAICALSALSFASRSLASDLCRCQACYIGQPVNLFLPPNPLKDSIRYANWELGYGLVVLCGL
jgi:hypothetical protein